VRLGHDFSECPIVLRYSIFNHFAAEVRYDNRTAQEAALLDSHKESGDSATRNLGSATLLLKRREAAELIGLSISELSELNSDINPTFPFVRLRPGGDKYWTVEGLQTAIDRLYREQMPTHLFPGRLLQAA